MKSRIGNKIYTRYTNPAETILAKRKNLAR